MIKIDFSSAVSAYLCISISLVFALWIFYNYRRDGIHNTPEPLEQCPYCTYMFFDYGAGTAEGTGIRDKAEPRWTAWNAARIRSQTVKADDQTTRFLVCPRCHSYINPESYNDEKES